MKISHLTIFSQFRNRRLLGKPGFKTLCAVVNHRSKNQPSTYPSTVADDQLSSKCHHLCSYNRTNRWSVANPLIRKIHRDCSNVIFLHETHFCLCKNISFKVTPLFDLSTHEWVSERCCTAFSIQFLLQPPLSSVTTIRSAAISLEFTEDLLGKSHSEKNQLTIIMWQLECILN